MCGSDHGVVWAHCNEQMAGKGMGIKAHDLIGAYLCSDCHRLYDEQSSRDEQHAFFREAFFNTMIVVAGKLSRKEIRL